MQNLGCTKIQNQLNSTFLWLLGSRILGGKRLYLAGSFEDGTVTKCITTNDVENIQKMYTREEEADPGMFLQVSMPWMAVLKSQLIWHRCRCFFVQYFEHTSKCSDLYFYTGTTEKRRLIPIHKIFRVLGSTLSSILQSLHALTSCDYTRAVADFNVLQQTACLVFNPITVGKFNFLFKCTPVGWTSDSMTGPTYLLMRW